MLIVDVLFLIFDIALFLHRSKYVLKSFKRKETKNERLVRESKEFMSGLRN
jgi:hypothetical protein